MKKSDIYLGLGSEISLPGEILNCAIKSSSVTSVPVAGFIAKLFMEVDARERERERKREKREQERECVLGAMEKQASYGEKG